jgi:tRNA (guanine37-N1)-methyltransferase
MSKCLKIPKKQGERALELARKLEVIDNRLEIQRDKTHLYVPLLNKPPEDKLKSLKEQIPSLEIITHSFPEKEPQQPSLAELLEDKLPKRLLSTLPHAGDFVGDIGIVEIPSELEPYKIVIGEAILEANKNLQTVLAKAGAVSGPYRLREFTVIAGTPKTETVHNEYGCRFYVDVARAFFSPRLSYEHNRVASLVQEYESVVDLFAGVGPFAVMIAKRRQNARVYAVDINPEAIAFLKKNIRLNRVDGKVHPILGDARQVASRRLADVADRVIMNLPETAIEFVDAACRALKPQGGIVHFYSFTTASFSLEHTQDVFAEAVERNRRKVDEFLFCRSVRETAPHEHQVVLDVRIL